MRQQEICMLVGLFVVAIVWRRSLRRVFHILTSQNSQVKTKKRREEKRSGCLDS